MLNIGRGTATHLEIAFDTANVTSGEYHRLLEKLEGASFFIPQEVRDYFAKPDLQKLKHSSESQAVYLSHTGMELTLTLPDYYVRFLNYLFAGLLVTNNAFPAEQELPPLIVTIGYRDIALNQLRDRYKISLETDGNFQDGNFTVMAGKLNVDRLPKEINRNRFLSVLSLN